MITPGTEKPIFGLCYESESDALKWAMLSLQMDFQKLGLQLEVFDLRDEKQFAKLYHELQRGACSCAVAYQGVGSQLKVGEENLWAKARVPFISIHYDHPCHRIENHLTQSPYIMNLYACGSHKEAYDRYVAPLVQGIRSSAAIPPTCCAMQLIAQSPYSAREIDYLYLKTGVRTDIYKEHIDSLPALLRDGAYDIIRRARLDPNLSLCDCVAALFRQDTFYTPDVQVEFWALVKAIDLFLRAERAIKFVEWLKMQPGAIIIGDGWDFIDKKHAKASFRPTLDLHKAYALLPQTKYICNTNPYGRDVVHERLMLGLIQGCCVISDSNEWWDSHFANATAFHKINWEQPIEDQLRPRLNTPPDPELVLRQAREVLDFFTRTPVAKHIHSAMAQQVSWLQARGL